MKHPRVVLTTLDGLRLIAVDPFEDFRGEFLQLYEKAQYSFLGVPEMVEEDIHIGRRGVLRGLHGSPTTWKLVSCLAGGIYFVAANNDPSSRQYRRWQAFTLSGTNHLQVLVPPKFGSGEVILSESAIVHYCQSDPYDPQSHFVIRWNDPAFGVWWPVKDPILARRDSDA